MHFLPYMESQHKYSYELMIILDLNKDNKLSKQEFTNRLKDKFSGVIIC